MLNNLSNAIKNNKLNALDRIGVISDAYSLTKSGRMKTSELLSLIESFSNEIEFTVLSEISSIINSVSYIFDMCKDNFNTFVCNIFSPTAKRLGWNSKDSDSDLDKLLRVLAISTAAKYGDKTIIHEALELFENNRESIDVDLRKTVYTIAVKYGNESNYNKVLDIYNNAPMHAEKLQALQALGSSTNPDLKIRTLDFSLSDSVRSQDLVYGPLSTSRTQEGTEITWKYFTEHYNDFCTKLAASGYLIARCIQYSATGFTSEEKAKQVEDFFNKNPTPQADRAIKQTLESIRAKDIWFKRDKDDVLLYFKN